MIRRVEPVSRYAAGPVSMLHRACFPAEGWEIGAVEQIMSMHGFFGCVGWENETPVGFALALDLGTEVEIVSLGVVREHRRRGVGLALLDALCREARLRGAQSAVLEVAVDNEAARALYAKRGFTIVGRRRNYYRQTGRSVDALILRVPLATAALEI
jgi:ribosomal-protein-alanine N-acetyltransferase